MKKQPTSETSATSVVTVLSVSPMEDDHATLQNIFNHSNWTLHKCRNLQAAIAFLQSHEVPVVLCESDLQPGTWKDMLEQVSALYHAPSLIVTSRLASDKLWSEVLNRGAYDLLAKPFDPDEVFRCVSSAWLHWRDQRATASKVLHAFQAAG
ncbi:MAG TPA: response regulator [Bryobacteraceae bacterium]|nr:response regulator [Bryobacteraceae bacterium]